jgi:hypothetical protein
MPNSLSGVLAKIPGYGGYSAQRQVNEQQGLDELKQASGALSLMNMLQRQKQEQELRSVLSQSGGDPERAIQALLTAGTPQSIELAAKLKGMMPKPAEPYTLAPGAQRRGIGNEVLAEAPMRPDKEQPPSNLLRLQNELMALPIEQRAAHLNAIRKESETPKQISPTVVMPQPPVAVVGPDGKPVFVSRENAIGKTPAVKETADRVIPASIVKAYTENSTALRKIDDAVKEVDAYPGAFGLQNVRGDALSQRIDPKGVTARAIIADIGSLKIHDRSGAAVTAAETPRLLPFIPTVNDKAETIKKKLALFKKEYEAIQADISSMYSAEQGYKAFPSAQTYPTATGPNGEKIQFKDGKWQPL